MNPTSRLIAGALCATAWLVGANAAEPPGPPPLEARLDATIEREHAARRFDGVVLAGRADKILYQRAIGLANRETRVPHTVDETWRLASVSKQVAALLVMQQVERGHVTLDAPLSELLPGFRSPSAAQLSMRNLLTHTSGLPNPDATAKPGSADDAVPPWYTQKFDDDAGPVDAALRYCAGAPTGPPGDFSYNNCDTLIVQAVLERLTGERYATLVSRAVATPLRLTQLGMATPRRPSWEVVTGYLDERRKEPALNLASFGASGALVGSVGDLWALDQALMAHRLLGEPATLEMWTGNPKQGYVALGAWSFPAALAGCDKPVALVERRGEIGGVQVRNLMAPGIGAAVIVLSNNGQTDFGEIWQGRGWMHELASTAFCAAAPGAPSHIGVQGLGQRRAR